MKTHVHIFVHNVSQQLGMRYHFQKYLLFPACLLWEGLQPFILLIRFIQFVWFGRFIVTDCKAWQSIDCHDIADIALIARPKANIWLKHQKTWMICTRILRSVYVTGNYLLSHRKMSSVNIPFANHVTIAFRHCHSMDNPESAFLSSPIHEQVYPGW